MLDIDRADSAIAPQAKGLNRAAYLRQANQRNAAYAHLVLNRLFTNAQMPGQAASAVGSIAAAAGTGQTVYAVTRANSAAVTPQLTLTATAKTELQDDVNAGYRALVAQAPISIGGWIGQGVVTEDPLSGAGSYRLTGDSGNATAALYPAGGMGWLALAEPFQSGAAVVPAALTCQTMDAILAAMLDRASNNTRWSFFPGQADVANGLFLARLAGAQGTQPCDSVIGILAANLDSGSGFASGGRCTRHYQRAGDPSGSGPGLRLCRAGQRSTGRHLRVSLVGCANRHDDQ